MRVSAIACVLALFLLSSLIFAQWNNCPKYNDRADCLSRCSSGSDDCASYVGSCDYYCKSAFPDETPSSEPPSTYNPTTTDYPVATGASAGVLACQNTCVNDQITCMNPCSTAFSSCQQSCAGLTSPDSCLEACSTTKDSCENACLGPKYTACLKPCYLAQGIPKKCVDLYDTLNPEPFTQCLMSLANTPVVPPTQAVCGDGVCDTEAGETAQSCPKDCAENCIDGIDNDQNGYIDCQDDSCKTNSACGPLKGKVYFSDVKSIGDRPIKKATMAVRWLDANGAQKESETFYSDAKGEYTYDTPEMHEPGVKSLSVFVWLVDYDSEVQVNEPTQPVGTSVEVDKSAWAKGDSIDVVLADENKDFADHPRNAGKIYFHMKEAADFITKIAGDNDFTKSVGMEKVYTYFDSEGLDNAFHQAHGSSSRSGAGIYFSSDVCAYDTPEGPTNKEYHEYGHHVMNSLMSMPVRHSADKNHGGISNDCSSDSWSEGFAEFYSLVTNVNYGTLKRCGGTEPYLYCVRQNGFSAETNWKPTEGRSYEERAVLGILWDLYDSESINGKPDDDSVSLSFPKIWQTLDQKRSFPVHFKNDPSPRYIWYVSDLYSALQEDKIAPANDIDAIFQSHGFYYHNDTSGKFVYGVQVAVKDPSDGNYYVKYNVSDQDVSFVRY